LNNGRENTQAGIAFLSGKIFNSLLCKITTTIRTKTETAVIILEICLSLIIIIFIRKSWVLPIEI
jgi:hypothetical protein